MENKIPEPNLEKEYLLPHEILSALVQSGMSITSTGTGLKSENRTPIYEFQVETTGMHLGALAMVLNNPEDLPKNKDNNLQYWRDLKITTDKINDTNYKLTEIAQTLEVLKFNEEITKESGSIWDIDRREPITLTKKGFISFSSKIYLKQYQKAKAEKDLHFSTLSTNFWMKVFTAVLTATAVITLGMQGYQIYTERSKAEPASQQGILKIDNTLQSIQANQKNMNLTLKELVTAIDSTNH